MLVLSVVVLKMAAKILLIMDQPACGTPMMLGSVGCLHPSVCDEGRVVAKCQKNTKD